MARAFRIMIIAVLALMLMLAAAFAVLFRTPAGRAALKPVVASALADAVGGEVRIGAIRGALPGEIVLSDLRFTDERGVWLAIDKAELRWRPLALLERRIGIDLAQVEGVKLFDAPPQREREAGRPRGFELPERLPSVAVRRFIVTDFQVAEAITGSPVRLDGAGAMEMGGQTLDINLHATSSSERDYVSIRIVREGDTLLSDINVASHADGAIAAAADLGGPIYVEAEGEGPLAGYRLNAAATLGAYVSFKGALSADLQRLEQIDFRAEAQLGERLSGLAAYVGHSAAIDGSFAPKDDGGALSLSRFQSELGLIDGMAQWRNRDGALASVDVAAKAAFNEQWRPDLQHYIGSHLAIRGKLEPDGEAYVATADIKAALLDGRLRAIKTDLGTFARGPAEIRLSANEALPSGLNQGVEASGEFDFVFDKGVSASPLSLKTASGATFTGDASYEFQSRAFALKGDASAPPSLLAALNSRINATRPASAAIDIRGETDKFSGRIVATTPPILFDKHPLPASRGAIAFTDMPSTPAGEVSVRALDGSRRLGANFAKNEDGLWRLRGVDYSGRDFALKGSASFNPRRKEGAVDLAYSGGEGAEPFPGVTLAGAFEAKGEIARGAVANRLALRADALSTGDLAIAGLAANVDGPFDALVVKASADHITIRGAAPISGLATEMTAHPGDIVRLTVRSLGAEIAGAQIKLARSAEISLADGVAIDNFRAEIGRRGSLALDGAVGKSRWRGKLSARRAPIVSAASVVDLDLDLDTDRKTVANGAFTLTSLLTDEETTSLAGVFAWDGRIVSIADDGSSEAAEIALALPARLIRAPSLRIDTKGPLSGAARYEGRVETIAAFLPPALQSIEGALSFSGAASGTFADPALSGSVTIADGAYTELSTGLSIVDIDATARADAAASRSRIEFTAAGAGAGQTGKTITAKGAVTLGDSPNLSSTITLAGARLSAGPITEADASGEITLSGPFKDLRAEGDIAIRRLDAQVITPETTGLVDIDVVAVNGDSAPTKRAAAPPAPAAVSYRIRIKGDDRIFVRGRGLTSEWRADAEIIGRADKPIVLGTMTMKSGEIIFAGRRFEMTRGEIAFDRLSPNDPSLDIRADRETGSGTTAAIVITGRSRTPKIALQSSPVLPPEDVMALVLFDKPATELSALQSLQVAEGLAELGGIGPFGGRGLTGSARSALGLDLLNFDIDQTDSAASTLTVGKYVAEGLFVSATQDARGENGSVRIEYEIDDSFTVETELRQDGDQKASVNWKRDF